MLGYHDYAGVIHIHSTYSDGLKNLQEIIKAANEAGCDYMILTDHNTLKALPQEGWYRNTILLVGEEITVGKDQGHYLAICLTTEVSSNQSAQKTLNNVTEQGGIGFIAHPFVKANDFILNLNPVPWQDWNVTGFNGIEIWNYSKDWVESFNGPLTFPLGLINPNSFIDGPMTEALNKWDELLRNQKVTGIGSVDAHGYFYSYKRMFKTVRTHVLLREALSFKTTSFEKDKINMYSADNGHLELIMGDELSLRKGVELKILSPQTGLLRIINNGKVVASNTDSKSLITTVNKPGAYRAEAFLKTFKGLEKSYRPWVFSNQIYII